MMHHTFDAFEITWYYDLSRNSIHNLGTIGIFNFFLLSGFLISYTVKKKGLSGKYDFQTYLIERFTRIYLVFLPALLLAGFLAFILKNQSPNASLEQFTTNLFMLQGVNGFSEHGQTFARMGPTWSLNYEVFFYILFGIAVLPIQNKIWEGLIKITLLLTVSWAAFRLSHIVPMAIAWVLGVGASAIHQRTTSIPPSIAIVGGAIAIAALQLIAPYTDAIYVYLLTNTVLFILCIISIREIKVARLLQNIVKSLAGYSYSLYLTHMLTLWILTSYSISFRNILQRTNTILSIVVVIFIISFFSYIFAYCTERHNYRVRQYFLQLANKIPK